MREGRVVRHNARRQNFSFTVAVFARSNKETRNRNIGFFFSLLLTWIREFLFENTGERGRMIIVQRRDYLLQHLYSPRKRDVINLAMRRTISLVEKTAANAYLSLLRSLWYQTGRKSVARIFYFDIAKFFPIGVSVCDSCSEGKLRFKPILLGIMRVRGVFI